MNIIQPSYEILTIPEPTDRVAVLKYLENIGRVCYHSEDKITDTSYINFLNNLKIRRHRAMLEHYIFVFSVSKEIFDDIAFTLYIGPDDADFVNKKNFIQYTYWDDTENEDYRYLVSGSFTSFNYLWECDCFKEDDTHGIVKLSNFLYKQFPEVMSDPWLYKDVDTSGIRFLSRNEIENLPEGLRLVHDFSTVRFTVDRGISHELVRHRPCSWAHESTRYCNYYPSDKKVNGKDLNIIVPLFTGEHKDELKEIWDNVIKVAEDAYNKMIELGATPQIARSVLPHSTKGDIFLTARYYEYIHFYNMRADKTSHPQMRQVVVPLLIEMHEKTKLFEYQMYLICEEDRKLWL